MGDDQIWKFRKGNDNDSSSDDDSKSSSKAAPEKHNHVPSLISVEDAEETGTRRVEQIRTSNPRTEDQITSGKGKNAKPRTRGKKSSIDDGTERVEGSRKKCKLSDYDQAAAMLDFERYSESLLEDFKATGENMLSWMNQEMLKMVVPVEKREGSSRGKNVPMQHGGNSKENTIRVNYPIELQNIEDDIEMNCPIQSFTALLLQNETNLEGYGSAQNRNNFKQVQHLRNVQEATFQAQRTQQCGLGSLERTVGSNELAQAAGHDNNYLLREQVNGQRTRALISRENLVSYMKPNFQTTDSNVQIRHQMNYLSGSGPQNYSFRSLGGTSKGKERVQSVNYHPLIERQVNRVREIGRVASSGIEQGSLLRLPAESSFYSSASSQVASAPRYLPSPCVLPRHNNFRPYRVDTSYNYIQPTVATMTSSVDLGLEPLGIPSQVRMMHEGTSSRFSRRSHARTEEYLYNNGSRSTSRPQGNTPGN